MVADRLTNKGRSQEDKVFVDETCIIFIYEKYIRDSFQIGTYREVLVDGHVIL